MIKIQNPDDIYEWTLEKLWKTVKTYEEEYTEKEITLKQQYKKELQIVKNGIKLKLPIHYLIYGWYTEYPNTKGVKVQGHGVFNIMEFLEERERRENILRTIILENLEDESTTEPR